MTFCIYLVRKCLLVVLQKDVCGNHACLHVQYRSNVSYHFLSRFSRDASHFSRDESRFSREASRFARESLKHLVWNILYMYYSQEASAHIKDGATILTFKHQQKVRWNVHCKIRCVLIDCSIHVEQIYWTFVYKSRFSATWYFQTSYERQKCNRNSEKLDTFLWATNAKI